ncbi:MAG: hypothetical protein ACI9O3_001633, partial [Colwellia sp.]
MFQDDDKSAHQILPLSTDFVTKLQTPNKVTSPVILL